MTTTTCTRRPYLPALLLAAAVAVVGGCAGDKKDPARSTSADVLRPDDRKFELAKDPPFTANTHFAAGRLAESQGNHAGAIQQYHKALAIDERHVGTLYRLGLVYSQTKQHAQAIATWNRYIAATNGDATGYSNLGFCYELAGQPTEAEAAYLKGIERSPTNQPCRVNYGLMLARAGDYAKAEEHLGAVLTPAEVRYNIASVLEQQGRRQEARAEYRRALELNPNLRAAQTRLAAIE